MSLGFNFSIGAHSISEEVAGFSPLWFPQGKLFVSLVIIVVYVILSDKILRSYCLNDKNITLKHTTGSIPKKISNPLPTSQLRCGRMKGNELRRLRQIRKEFIKGGNPTLIHDKIGKRCKYLHLIVFPHRLVSNRAG